ncbi:MAG: alcohol dehydrogenase catalytic domain-containing protein, partial [Salinisphaeraceae bacterium]|nr:alcohol dehydrogenase catalytic domain-containing protein [Salinisphaeraceae bacterium]
MKSVVCQNKELSVVEREPLKPAKGQVLLEVLRCGICGSDLHMRQHCDHMQKSIRGQGYEHFPSSKDPVVFGHEFCGEVVDFGPKTKKRVKPGSMVCAVPLLRLEDRIDLIGLSATSAGAYAEQIIVQEALMMPVPNGLPADEAALTEPMAVGLHAVNRSEIRKRDVAIVIGCGPVGLAVI